MTVGRVPTVGDAPHTLHRMERGVEAVTASGALTSSRVVVGGLGSLSTGLGGSGSSHAARSSGSGELIVDSGEKYTGSCSVDRRVVRVPGRLSDETMTPFSPSTIFVDYWVSAFCSVGG